MIKICSVRLIDGATNLGISTLLHRSAATSVTCLLTIVLRMCL